MKQTTLNGDELSINPLKVAVCCFAVAFCYLKLDGFLLKNWDWYNTAISSFVFDMPVRTLIAIFIQAGTMAIVAHLVRRGKPEWFVKWVTK